MGCGACALHAHPTSDIPVICAMMASHNKVGMKIIIFTSSGDNSQAGLGPKIMTNVVFPPNIGIIVII